MRGVRPLLEKKQEMRSVPAVVYSALSSTTKALWILTSDLGLREGLKRGGWLRRGQRKGQRRRRCGWSQYEIAIEKQKEGEKGEEEEKTSIEAWEKRKEERTGRSRRCSPLRDFEWRRRRTRTMGISRSREKAHEVRAHEASNSKKERDSPLNDLHPARHPSEDGVLAVEEGGGC
jgi:hypothetical protein